MAPRDPSTRFHPYDSAKKPKIHRANGGSKNIKKNNDTTLPKLTQQSGSGLSINDLKRRIRDVKRLLARHADLSPEARIVQERALAGYERDLEGEQERRARSEMIKKYHFVRFLATKELRTAQRRLEKIKNQGGTSKEELAKLQADIDTAQINVNYTIYYPLTEKYISLYPQAKKQKRNSDDDDDDNDSNNENTDESKPEDAPATINEKPPMWDMVKKCTRENTLDKLRDGKLSLGSSKSVSGSNKEHAKEKKDITNPAPSSSKRAKKEEVQMEEEEDSDGGFFEE